MIEIQIQNFTCPGYAHHGHQNKKYYFSSSSFYENNMHVLNFIKHKLIHPSVVNSANQNICPFFQQQNKFITIYKQNLADGEQHMLVSLEYDYTSAWRIRNIATSVYCIILYIFNSKHPLCKPCISLVLLTKSQSPNYSTSFTYIYICHA